MKTLLVTLVVGQNRVPQVNKLIESFNNHTEYDIMVYHDINTTVDYDNTVELGIFTDAPLKFKTIFNYDLKGIVTHHAYMTYPEYDRIIFSDCDVQITKPSALLDSFNKEDIYASYTHFSESHAKAAAGRKLKKVLSFLNIETTTSLKYLTETFLIFNRSTATDEFIEKWSGLCNLMPKNGIVPCFECVEIGIAVKLTPGLTIKNLTGSGLGREECLVTDHREKLIPLVRH